jgi:hypothetical protein
MEIAFHVKLAINAFAVTFSVIRFLAVMAAPGFIVDAWIVSPFARSYNALNKTIANLATAFHAVLDANSAHKLAMAPVSVLFHAVTGVNA